MATEQYVSKKEFDALVEKFNNLCEELSNANIKKTIDFDDYQHEYDSESSESENEESESQGSEEDVF